MILSTLRSCLMILGIAIKSPQTQNCMQIYMHEHKMKFDKGKGLLYNLLSDKHRNLLQLLSPAPQELPRIPATHNNQDEIKIS